MPPLVPPPIIPNGQQLQVGPIINPPLLPRGPGGGPPVRANNPAVPLTPVQQRQNRTIADVCRRQEGVLPRECYSQYGREMLFHPNNQPDLRERHMAERLLTCLSATPLGDNSWKTITDQYTVARYRAMDEHGQLDLINRIWNALSTTHAFSTPAAQMYDPDYSVPPDDRAPLPSSWCPTARGATTHHKRLVGRRPWRELCVGFRIDGSDQTAIDRNTSQGFKQQRLAEGFMLGVRGQRIDMTVLMNQALARVWTGNRDIFNESAVCVSRNFFGATAFPERETNHILIGPPDAPDRAYLWALNCEGMRGFDTEAYQLGLGNASQWRPGEKAFASFPAGRVIGYLRIQRLGAPIDGGWVFRIADDAQWVFTGGSASDAQRRYMVDELNAWRGVNVVPAAFDFATA